MKTIKNKFKRLNLHLSKNNINFAVHSHLTLHVSAVEYKNKE